MTNFRIARIACILVASVLSTGITTAQVLVSTSTLAPWANNVAFFEVADIDQNGIADVFYVMGLSSSAQPSVIALAMNQGIAPAPAATPNIVFTTWTAGLASITLMRIGDFDGDGVQDLLVGSGAIPGLAITVGVLHGLGGGAFAAQPTTVISGPTITSPIVADFDADGTMDVAWGVNLSQTGGEIQVRLGGPTALSTIAFSRVLNGPTYGIGFGDFNGDGFADLIYDVTPAGSEIIFGRPAGSVPTFLPPQTTAQEEVNMSYEVDRANDIDGDGCDDIVNLGALTWYRGSPGGTFTGSPMSVNLTGWSTRVDRAHVDTDGLGDAIIPIVANANPIVTWFASRYTGPGPLSLRSIATVNTSAPFLSYNATQNLGDLDGDGDTDALVIERNGYNSRIQTVENRARYGAGSPGTAGMPRMFNTTPYLGAPAFTIGVDQVTPSGTAFLLLSLNALPAIGNGIHVDLSPQSLLLINGQLPYAGPTTNGAAGFSVAVPNVPTLAGTVVYGQWAILDPLGAFLLGGLPFALTDARAFRF